MTAPGKPKSDLSSTSPSVSAAITKREGAAIRDETPVASKASNVATQITSTVDSDDLGWEWVRAVIFSHLGDSGVTRLDALLSSTKARYDSLGRPLTEAHSKCEQRFAKIVAATGVKPDYLPTWCDERERETAMLRGLDYPYWTIKDPSGHLVHTVLSCDKDEAIREWLETEQAVQWAANLFRTAAGKQPCCAQSWELFEAQGYSLARVDIIEKRLLSRKGPRRYDGSG